MLHLWKHFLTQKLNSSKDPKHLMWQYTAMFTIQVLKSNVKAFQRFPARRDI